MFRAPLIFLALIVCPQLAIANDINAECHSIPHTKTNHNTIQLEYIHRYNITPPDNSYYFNETRFLNGINYELHGPYKIIYNEILNQFKSEYQNQLYNYYSESYTMSYSDLCRELEEFEIFQTTNENNFWQYYSEENGGSQRSYTQTVGSTHEIIRIGSFNLTNEFRGSIKRFGIYLDNNNQDIIQQIRTNNQTTQDFENRILTFQETNSFINNTSYRLKFRPSININFLEYDLLEVIKNISLKIDAEIFYNKSHVLNLGLAIRYQPSDNELIMAIQLETVTW